MFAYGAPRKEDMFREYFPCCKISKDIQVTPIFHIFRTPKRIKIRDGAKEKSRGGVDKKMPSRKEIVL